MVWHPRKRQKRWHHCPSSRRHRLSHPRISRDIKLKWRYPSSHRQSLPSPTKSQPSVISIFFKLIKTSQCHSLQAITNLSYQFILRAQVLMRQLQRSQPPTPTDKLSPEELLVQIRNLISPKERQVTPRHMNSQEIQEILKASFDTYKKIQHDKGKTHLRQRAKEAVQLVQVHHPEPFVQQYTQQKVYSELFSNLRGPLSVEESRAFQREREELLKQKQVEEEQQRKRESMVIASRKKFIRYESNELPFGTISELTMKEGDASLHYLMHQSAQKKQNSTNNLIKSEQDQKLEMKYQEMRKGAINHSSSSRLVKDQEGQVFQFVDDSIDEATFKVQYQQKILNVLDKSPKFVEVFKTILKKSIAYNKHLNQNDSINKKRNSLLRNNQFFKYSGQTQVFNRQRDGLKPESVAHLTRAYNSKGLILKQMAGKSIHKEEAYICQKSISKMKGDSESFHVKKVRLKEDQITWCFEVEDFSQDSKRVTLVVQQLKIVPAYKEEGGIFSSNRSEVQVVHVKGKKRDLKFQLNIQQGQELYKQLCILMAKKLLHLNMILKHSVNPDLMNFVENDQAKTFSLAAASLQDLQKYPDKDFRLMIINILSALFPFRKEVTYFNLSKVNFNILEISTIIKTIHPLINLQKIEISQTKFSGQSFSILMQFISTLSCKTFDLSLSQCLISDQILKKGKEPLLKCVNIQKLNLSDNEISISGFGLLIDLVSQPNCKLKEFNISKCQIINLYSLGQFVKKADHIQILYAEDCGFSYNNNEEQLSAFFNCCKGKSINKLSLLHNDVVSNLKIFQEVWLADSLKEIMIDVGTFAEKTSKNIQGKLIY